MEWIGSVIASVITGVLALVGIIITSIMSNKQIEHKLEINQAVTTTKLENLMEEVKEHTSGVQRIPVIESKMEGLERRVSSLEEKVS